MPQTDIIDQTFDKLIQLLNTAQNKNINHYKCCAMILQAKELLNN